MTEGSNGPYFADDYRADESVGYLIKRVKMALSAAVDREISAYDISHDQWGILVMISQGHGETAAELSREMTCDTGAMTRMIDRLETKGLVKRTRCAADRRVVKLALTDAGQALAGQLPTVIVRVLNRHLNGFSVEEVDTLKGLLRRMLCNAQAEGAMNKMGIEK